MRHGMSNKKAKKKRKKKGKRKSRGDAVLSMYNTICTSLVEQTRGEGVGLVLGPEEKEKEEVWSFLWARMREARIFIIPSTAYNDALNAAASQVLQVAFGVKEDLSSFGALVDDPDTNKDLVDIICEMSERVDPPDQKEWPFPTLWLSFDQPVTMSGAAVNTTISATVRELIGQQNLTGVRIVGFLLTHNHQREPYITMVCSVEDIEKGVGHLLWPTVYKPDQGWMHPSDLSPWVSHHLIRFLNSFGSYEEELPSLNARFAHKTESKKLKVQLPVPKPYYIVTLKKEITPRSDKRPEKGYKSWELSFRFDVRGHYRVLYERFNHTLSEKERKRLIDRNYRIYKYGTVKPYDKKRLEKRGVALPRPGETLVVQVIWVKHHVRGPEDAPYIPSIRRAV
jgi:hypothetical protein